ncbi:hypothetical protein PYW07_010408 [Mythimna separata]|uniref:Serpin domain-containing protein n=1 Tax=Mythimna separata TaxID=271217 RepID=A0AAD8DLN6_MYTSE|nr:hypothetical protein PYW07_010408 [Mythimna separata]
MRLPIAVLALCIAHSVHSQGIIDSIIRAPDDILNGATSVFNGIFGGKTTDQCAQDVTENYRKAIIAFNHKLYINIAAHSDDHFVFSPSAIWLSLSALAEGADPAVQSQVFTSLNLPLQQCIREKFYDKALNVERPGRDVSLRRQRTLLLDQSLKVNPSWSKMAQSTGLLNYAFAPIKTNRKATSRRVRKFLSTRSHIHLKGNSVLLDSLDYQGLWTTAFPDADIQSQPFFNELGQKIGTVDMMHVQMKVRLAQVPFMSAKVVELPVGVDGRYTMLIAVGTGNDIIKNAIQIFMGSIMEIFSLLQMSLFPLDVAIPRFAITSEFDARPALEDFGIRSFWRDPAATRYVSNPPAAPGGLIQRVAIKVDNQGVSPPPQVGNDLISGLVNIASNTATGVARVVGHEFVADRPFLFALFDTERRTCLFAGAFSRPNTLE